MAALKGKTKVTELSKEEYLKRYMSADDLKSSKVKIKKKRPKVGGKGLRIVDDDIQGKFMVKKQERIDEDEDDEAPVIAEIIDDRPEEVKQMEIFRVANRWKVIGEDKNKDEENEKGNTEPDTSRAGQPSGKGKKKKHKNKDEENGKGNAEPDTSRADQPSRKGKKKKLSLHKKKPMSSKHGQTSSSQSSVKRHDSDSDQSPPRKKTVKPDSSDSDQSPPRKTKPGSDADQSPPRRRTHVNRDSDGDLSPPRQPGRFQEKRMFSGGRAGLVSAEVLREEKEENRRREKSNVHLEVDSRNAETVFRDKSGKRRDLDAERDEKRKKDEDNAAKDEKYAQWGKGLAQTQMQQQQLEDALHEANKPLARLKDDKDLDRYLREQEREGDPMAAMLKRKNERKTHTSAKPRYQGPPPPLNRFNIQPGYRWDGVDRSNGFEKKRFSRIAEKKAMQEIAYKWSVEDM